VLLIVVLTGLGGASQEKSAARIFLARFLVTGFAGFARLKG
jgi:hypothetical protein